MTGLVRKTTLLCVGALMLAGAAVAGVPTGANSQLPCIILMDYPNSGPGSAGNAGTAVGPNSGVCAVGGLQIIVRDGNNQVVPFSEVVIDFSLCSTTDVKPGSVQTDAAVTVGCAGRTFTKTADVNGQACFSFEGGSNLNPTPIAGALCARIFASGQLIASSRKVIVNRYDLNGSSTVTAGDRSIVLDDEAGGLPNGAEDDYNCDGAVTATDRGLMLDAEGQGQAVYAGTYCP